MNKIINGDNINTGSSIFSPKNEYVYIIDPGHGINTPGKRSPIWSDGSQLFEYEYSRAIAKYLESYLDEYQYKYYNVCPEITDTPLPIRISRANKYMKSIGKKCLYISIHGNASDNKSAHGFEVFTSLGLTTSDFCAQILYDKVEESGLFRMRPCFADGLPGKEQNFMVLRDTAMPAILSENGFFTNKIECDKMMTDDFRKKVAKLHFDAIVDIDANSILDKK